MDPYLEPHWLDVHTSLETSARNALNERLPDHLVARAEERIAIEAGPDDPLNPGLERRLAPDVRVFEAVAEGEAAVAGNAGGLALAPYRLLLLDEPVTERFIEIIDVREGERLVTVIEFVSPTNKAGRGLSAFVQKRSELLGGGVSFVEIDLSRAGDWRRLLEPHRCPDRAVSTYRAVIRVPHDPFAAYLQPLSLRGPLPAVRIPLRRDDPPTELPLQPMIDEAYRNGRYGRTLNYARPADPPLPASDDEWADTLLKGAGKR